MSEQSKPSEQRLSLFEAFGVELEYMIVDTAALNVLPMSDRLIEAASGSLQSDFDNGRISWSNELVLHVIELKTTEPASDLRTLADEFQSQVQLANQHLAAIRPAGCLLPSAMHPWMDPIREMRLWPHECSPVYEAFDRIFDCRGHGWANLQSVHLNLPFANDDEFGRLHAAIRLVLPLLPAIAAASPVINGHLNGLMDNRLDVYRSNSAKIPEIAGQVIPEPVYTYEEYAREIFEPMYAAVAPFDPEGILQHEFLNARGAIARFDRGSIEIRVIDIQECPAADMAVLQATVAVLKALVGETWSSFADQASVPVDVLQPVLLAAIRDAEQAVLSDPRILRLFGFTGDVCSFGQLWRHLMDATCPDMDAASAGALKMILDRGPLARRVSDCLQDRENHQPPIVRTYRRLAECLQQGREFGL